MSSADTWRQLPVWRCLSESCGERWGSDGQDSTCPFCHLTAIERTDFTYGQLADAQDRFGFSDIPVHLPSSVPEVVQLSTLAPDLWIGLPVFHPAAQSGASPDWRTFDVGVVVAFEPDPNLPQEYRCEFIAGFLGGTSTLKYSPQNLWVPAVLATRIAS